MAEEWSIEAMMKCSNFDVSDSIYFSWTLSSISLQVTTDITLFSKASFITPPRPTTKGLLRNYFSQPFSGKASAINFVYSRTITVS
jgi:hypothetical protein